MTYEHANIQVSVRYKDLDVNLTGTPEEVIRAFISLISSILPAYEFVSGLVLTVDLEKLLKSLKGLIAFTPEGPVIIVPKEKLGGERNVIVLNLVKVYVGYKTGRLEKDSLSTIEIGGKPGTVGARLSELTELEWVERVGRGEYRITTLGLKSFTDEILPKIKPGET